MLIAQQGPKTGLYRISCVVAPEVVLYQSNCLVYPHYYQYVCYAPPYEIYTLLSLGQLPRQSFIDTDGRPSRPLALMARAERLVTASLSNVCRGEPATLLATLIAVT